MELKVYLHPLNQKRLAVDDAEMVKEIESNYGVKLSFIANESYHVENFKVLDAKTGREVV